MLRKRIDIGHHDIPTKANRVLNVILVAIVLIMIRVWHLAIVQYDQRLEESRKPQKKVIIEPAIRATIRDRFNLPLAINKIQYQATILYSQIREGIPSFRWEKNALGQKVKVFKRKEYIRQLADLLAHELNLDTQRIEDLIHSKASYYAQIPFVIKEELTEKEYYRLKMLEKDWVGIHVRQVPKRYYPRGRVAADMIGYMGAINRQEYETILQEIKMLEQLIAAYEANEEMEWPQGIESSTQARKRLRDLEGKAYTIHDYIGKTGVEGAYEKQLRGFYGKKSFYSDSRGNFLRELPGSRPPLRGHRVLLTISAELQEYAEQLLTQNEVLRVVRKSNLEEKKTLVARKHPWIKGGAIVVMDPHTGDILTLASYPRFDSNDFIVSGNKETNNKKKFRINRWFENEMYLASIWDQQQPLKRERYDEERSLFYDEKQWLTWEIYLNLVLNQESSIRQVMRDIQTIQQALEIQYQISQLQSIFKDKDLYTIFNTIYPAPKHIPYKQDGSRQLIDLALYQDRIQQIKQKLAPYFEKIASNYDKGLVTDLCRLVVDEERVSEDLIPFIQKETLSNYRDASASLVTITQLVKGISRELFHLIDFKNWRTQEEQRFLKKKREEEKVAKAYPKPYLDYLDQKEEELFKVFWQDNRWSFILTFLTGDQIEKKLELTPYLSQLANWSQEYKQELYQGMEWKKAYKKLSESVQKLPFRLQIPYLQTMRSYSDLNHPLFGRYRSLREHLHPVEKHLATAFYPVYGFGYGRSHAYRQAAIQGSIFKLVTAYQALIQTYCKSTQEPLTFRELNPLTMIDQVYRQGDSWYVGYTQEGKPIPQIYKGGRLPRSLAHQNNGQVDLIKALEVSSNPYFALLAGDYLSKPEDLTEAAKAFSYGSRTGIDLPAEFGGKVPDDVHSNRTGLYALAIGQHSLIVTPLQTAVMLSTIANGGKVLKPKIVNLMAGCQPNRGEDFFTCPPSFPYQESLAYIGIDFPLFTAIASKDQKSLIQTIPTEIRRELWMPAIVRLILLQGLQAAVKKAYHDSVASLSKLYRNYPEAIQCFNELKTQLLGKSSTSESVEHLDLDLQEGTGLYTHVWFGSIVLQESSINKKKTFLFKDEFGNPELVVVVYLRYGGYGKEAAPLAAQIVKKWREIQVKYEK
jgi:cell division protein FtsI/penicillin-binding protein 2